MKSLVFFGSKHKKQLCSHEEQAGCFPLETSLSLVPEYERLSQVLMDEISLELVQKLANPRESLSEETLAILLVLTCTSIFFGDNQVKWRTHLYEAKRVVMNQLKRKLGRKKVVLHYNVMGDEHDFLGRWFTYYDVVSCLSSADFIPESEVFSRVKVDFCPLTDVQLKQAMARLDDIQFVSGMEKNVLAYLAKVSRLVFMKLKGGPSLDEKALLVDAFELDYEILNYLEKGEQHRDVIFQSEFARDPKKLADPRIQDYKLASEGHKFNLWTDRSVAAQTESHGHAPGQPDGQGFADKSDKLDQPGSGLWVSFRAQSSLLLLLLWMRADGPITSVAPQRLRGALGHARRKGRGVCFPGKKRDERMLEVAEASFGGTC